LKARRDRRRIGALLTLLLVLLGGAWLDRRSAEPAAPAAPSPVRTAGQGELGRRFNEAVVMLHARQYEHAAVALDRVLRLSPSMPEAHVNMGYALLGLKRPGQARSHFDRATTLRPEQANAYYGLALAFEAEGDLAMATGAMRSYLHLARDERAEHLARARAALWEWQNKAKAARPG
jgi:tetratricopeptide (TPR) repeat protein